MGNKTIDGNIITFTAKHAGDGASKKVPLACKVEKIDFPTSDFAEHLIHVNHMYKILNKAKDIVKEHAEDNVLFIGLGMHGSIVTIGYQLESELFSKDTNPEITTIYTVELPV